ncbi:MAG: MATE family efflux transporter [Lachnospiraceae bacterium]|nr:MATE family efflux transporter [Lachnospiraceae bacterium]
MSSKKEISFTEGPIFGSLIRFAGPVLGALILQAAYGAVDLLVVGQFGDAASISAVGTASSFMQMITFIITSLAMGSTVLIGQHIGEKNPKAAGNAVGTTIVLFVIIGVVLTVVLEASAGMIVRLLQVPESAIDKAVLYLRICSGGLLIIITYNVISGILRGIGNANLPFIFVSIACVVNIAADLLLTGLLGMDVAGVAIATVFAQLVSVIISLGIIRRQRMPIEFSLSQCRIYPVELKKILHIGIPIALQETLSQVSFLVINSIVNGMGLMPSAGYGVAQKLVSFIMLIPSSVMQSVSAFVAQNIGAGQQKRAQRGYLTAMCTGVCIGVFVFLAGFFGGSTLASLFTSDAEVIAESASYLRGFSFDCILTCVMFSTSGYFNGCGNSVPVMLQGITASFCVRIPTALYMASLPGTSLFYIGLTVPISTLYGILFYGVCFAWLRRKKRNGTFSST